MLRPSIFGESLFDDWMDDFPFGKEFEKEMFPEKSPLYGKHAKNMMKTDVRETDDSYEVDIDLPGFKKDEVNVKLEDGYITISAAKGLDKDEKDKKTHHDIYSIEDLAQLIYDCKNANRDARISVKLVSEAGVGTVAAGVAKAGAQVILISGYDGGTGAAPNNSIHYAGLPWELGLAETHQTLIKNDLRNKVILETDGKLMTGRDVAIAAMLGAEEFGFATAPLVTMGCVMMRVCNLDTCPVGIATQNPELRKRFKGKPEYVINFMKFIAEELREYMSKLGVRTVDELVGRSDLLYAGKGAADRNVDLSLIINNPYIDAPQNKIKYNEKHPYDFQLEKTIDMRVLLKKLGPALEKGQKKSIEIDVVNTDRSVGTIFGSEITKRYGDALEDDSYLVKCNGAGGIIVHIIIVELYVFFVADKSHLDDQTCHICLFDNDVIVVTVKLCSGTDTTVIGDSDLFQIGQDGFCDRMVFFGTGAVDPCFYTTGLRVGCVVPVECQIEICVAVICNRSTIFGRNGRIIITRHDNFYSVFL